MMGRSFYAEPSTMSCQKSEPTCILVAELWPGLKIDFMAVKQALSKGKNIDADVSTMLKTLIA